MGAEHQTLCEAFKSLLLRQLRTFFVNAALGKLEYSTFSTAILFNSLLVIFLILLRECHRSILRDLLFERTGTTLIYIYT